MEEYNLRQYSFLPINAGMISLVYKVNDKTTGKDLILKVKRHNIREKLDSSIKNLLFWHKRFRRYCKNMIWFQRLDLNPA